MTANKTKIETVAKVLIIDSNNKALTLVLSEHRKHPEKSYRPDLPGGIVDDNESELEAAAREISEECGFIIDAATLRLAYSRTEYYDLENKSVTKILYITSINHAPEVILSWEHSEYKWVSIEDLKGIDFRPFFNDAIQYSINHNLI